MIGIEMGLAAGAGPAMLDLEELIATRLLVQGNSGSGKSHLLRRLLEQSAPHVQQIVIDPEGDFVGLAERFGHVVVDADRSDGDLRCLAERVREHRISVVLNLESLDLERQMRAAAVFIDSLFEMPREFWFPALVVVDEAQLFAPVAAGDFGEEARRVSLGALTNLMCRGRKRGLCGIIATQRLAKLAKNVAAEASNVYMGRTFLDIDIQRACDLLGLERRQGEMFRDLEKGAFMALGPALSRRPLKVKIGSVETAARGATPALSAPPAQASDDVKEMLFAPAPAPTGRAPRERRTVLPPPVPITELLARVEAGPPAGAGDAEAPPMEAEERIAALRATVGEVLSADDEATYRPDAVLYQDFAVRCRIKRIPGPPLPLPEFRNYLNDARAGVDPATAEMPDWRRVRQRAEGIAEDLRPVFLLVARAAMAGAPCPADAEIAKVCGTRSASRAKNRLAHLDKQGLIVMHANRRGLRIANLPDFGWETAAGDPNGDPDAAPLQDCRQAS